MHWQQKWPNKKEVSGSASMVERERSLGEVGSVWDPWAGVQLFFLRLLDDRRCFSVYESSIWQFTEDRDFVLFPWVVKLPTFEGCIVVLWWPQSPSCGRERSTQSGCWRGLWRLFWSWLVVFIISRRFSRLLSSVFVTRKLMRRKLAEDLSWKRIRWSMLDIDNRLAQSLFFWASFLCG